MKTKLTAQKALKLFHLWEELIISGELPDPKRFNQDFLKFYGGGGGNQKKHPMRSCSTLLWVH